MKDLTQRELVALLKSNGIPQSQSSMSSRVRGWSNSISEGFSIVGLYPFKTKWQRNHRIYRETSDEQTHSATLSVYNRDTEKNKIMFDKLVKVLTDNEVNFSESQSYKYSVGVNIVNPFI